jgi:cytidyltransferase-like protein
MGRHNVIVGYTNGYFDLIHVGHLSLIESSAALCDKLIVGVISDEESKKRKQKTPVIPHLQRLELVKNIVGVDVAVPVFEDDKYKEWEKFKYDILFVGQDHYGEEIWEKHEKDLIGKAKVIYLPLVGGDNKVSTSEIIKRCANS